MDTSEYREGSTGDEAPPAAGPAGPVELFDALELDRVYSGRTVDSKTLQPDEASLQTLRDLTIRWSDRISDRPAFTLAWPSGLYIPGAADWRQYWITKPPAGNLFKYAWTGATGPAPGTFADKDHGNLAAVISPTSLSGTFQAWAGIASEYTPSALLSQVRFTADVTALGVEQLTLLAEHPIGQVQVNLFADLFLMGWEINPVTGEWDKLSPFLRHNVYSSPHSGEQGGPNLYHPLSLTGSTLGVNFLVERGKRYAFGVVVETAVVADVRQPNGRSPYMPQLGDNVAVEARLGGSITQMNVDTTIVYQA
ncbi:MAG: hypothetical protein QOI76_4245 [Frankiales bacterium]|nr:hypothetical protein [Frankiales bacterium]